MNLRLPADLDAWLESQAGGKREKPAFVRRLLERERAREEEEEILKMFNSAWDSLSPEEQARILEERENCSFLHAAPKLTRFGLVAVRRRKGAARVDRQYL